MFQNFVSLTIESASKIRGLVRRGLSGAAPTYVSHFCQTQQKKARPICILSKLIDERQIEQLGRK
jgi:antirestriction protein ArdC